MENNFSSADDLKTIRKIMEDSTRFLSLSGLSGVFAGALALAGAIVAWLFILKGTPLFGEEFQNNLTAQQASTVKWELIADALAVLSISSFFALYLSARKARRAGRSLWTPVSKRLLLNFSLPLFTGGIFAIILLIHDYNQLIVPALLIFYGLSLINAGKFTYGEVFYLGLLEISTGMLAMIFPGNGLLFWTFGFGILHLAYGIFMYRKYES